MSYLNLPDGENQTAFEGTGRKEGRRLGFFFFFSYGTNYFISVVDHPAPWDVILPRERVANLQGLEGLLIPADEER